jgi:DNA-binding response OmpR family regulator
MSGRTRRVLVVEDDREVARLLLVHLEDLGCEVHLCHDGLSGLTRALDGTAWSLLVLDLHLPILDGVEICRRIRAGATYIPILMLTGRASEIDRVRGLETGADDYLTKPFSVLEFAARAKAILRRTEQFASPPEPGRVLRCADLEIDLDRRRVRRSGRSVDLTATEFELIACLLQHPGRVFTRAQLLDQVRGVTHESLDNTITTHINRLRAKLEPNPARPRYVITVRGVGYQCCPRE